MKKTDPKNRVSDIYCSRAIPIEGYEPGEIIWRIEHLWAHPDGYTVCDSDGDHEKFDGRRVHTYIREAAQSWQEYAKYCAETGQDPLGNYSVQRTTQRTRNYTIYWRSWLGASEYGLAVYEALGQGKRITPDKFPQHLTEFLCLKRQGAVWYMDGIHKPEDMIEAGCVGNGYAKISVEFKVPRNPKIIANEIRRAAQFHFSK